MAQRLAFFVLNMPPEYAHELSNAIVEARESVRRCSVCMNLTDDDPCAVCNNSKRNHGLIMVVEEPKDMAAYEKTRAYSGLYHILHGAISPLNGVGPSDLCIKELLTRVDELGDTLQEVIIATNPNVEGEATALYLARVLKPLGITVTRIAHGVPIGSDLEHVDEATLSHAFAGRREM